MRVSLVCFSRAGDESVAGAQLDGESVDEIYADLYPKRPIPRDEDAMKALKKRTLKNLYSARPTWLIDAHTALDSAAASAYRWPVDVADEDALRNLL